jgi:hypothetical protein
VSKNKAIDMKSRKDLTNSFLILENEYSGSIENTEERRTDIVRRKKNMIFIFFVFLGLSKIRSKIKENIAR